MILVSISPNMKMRLESEYLYYDDFNIKEVNEETSQTIRGERSANK